MSVDLGGVKVPQTILDTRKIRRRNTQTMDAKFVEDIIAQAMAPYPELFVVEWSLSPENDIRVVVDGDRGVDMEAIVALSRAVEHHPGMDREREDFSISVLSPGADAPLRSPRQYAKHVGRELKVDTADGESITGTLVRADAQEIVLEWSVREPKPVGKGRHTVVKTRQIPFANIAKARVVLKF